MNKSYWVEIFLVVVYACVRAFPRGIREKEASVYLEDHAGGIIGWYRKTDQQKNKSKQKY